MATGWKYLLGRSADMSIIGELTSATGRALQYNDNGSGSSSFAISIDEEIADFVWPWKTCLIAQRDDTWRWSGPITTCPIDGASRKMSITAVGWFEKLMHLLFKLKTTFTNEDAGAIAAALIGLANDQYAAFGLGDCRISVGSIAPTQLRTMVYERDAGIGQAIQDLATLESGYDWFIDPVTREFNIVERRGIDRPNCKWLWINEQGKAQGNLKNYTKGIDGTNMVNEITPRGKFSFGYATDIDSMFEHDIVMSEAPSLSEVTNPDVLNAFANEEIVYRSTPRITYTIFPKTAVARSASQGPLDYVPRLFDDFDIGDTSRLTIRDGIVQLTDQAQRIFGVDMAIDDVSGLETINNLQTTATA